MRRNFLICLYFVCFWTGVVSLCYRLLRKSTLILSYHNVLPDELYDCSLHLGVSHRRSEFVRQVEIVRKRFRTVTDATMDAPRHCVVTFDDGYANNLWAANHLESLGIRAVFFVPVEPLTTSQSIAVDRIMQWFSYVAPGKYSAGSRKIEIAEHKRAEAYSSLYAWLLREPSLWESIPDLLDAASPFSSLAISGELRRERFQPMSEEQLRGLMANGHVIGCHSWNHRPLATLSDEELARDFDNCRAAKARLAMSTYCYPFGGVEEVDERALRTCRQHGYEAGFLNIERNPFSRTRDRLALPREALPQETNRYIIEAKLSGLEFALKRLLRPE